MNPPQNILVPIDFSETSTHALTYAQTVARACRASVHVLHVIPDPRAEAWSVEAAGMNLDGLLETWRTDTQRRLDELTVNMPSYLILRPGGRRSAGRQCALPVKAAVARAGHKPPRLARPRGVGAPPAGHVGRRAATRDRPAEDAPLTRPGLRVDERCEVGRVGRRSHRSTRGHSVGDQVSAPCSGLARHQACRDTRGGRPCRRRPPRS